MEFDPAQKMRRTFDRLFRPLGGGLSERTEYEQGISHLANGLADALGADGASIFCGIVRNFETNAWIVKEQDTVFIGISAGFERSVFLSIGAALKKLSSSKLIHHSAVEELQSILNMYAMGFVISHMIGHIVLGHLDKTPELIRWAGEASMSNTTLEEAHADMIGALGMISLKTFLDRVILLATMPTALGLLQLPVLCVLSELKRHMTNPRRGLDLPLRSA
jgi:hypothetical protein